MTFSVVFEFSEISKSFNQNNWLISKPLKLVVFIKILHTQSETLHKQVSEYFIASFCVMMTSVAGFLSDRQALWLHSWEQDRATSSETRHWHARFVTHRSRYKAVPLVWLACGPSCSGWLCPRHAAVGTGVLSSPRLTQRAHASAWHMIDACILACIQIGGGEVLHSPHKKENLGANLPEQFIYSSSRSSSLCKVPLGKKWQDKSFGLSYSEQLCGLWISHAHSSIYMYYC